MAYYRAVRRFDCSFERLIDSHGIRHGHICCRRLRCLALGSCGAVFLFPQSCAELCDKDVRAFQPVRKLDENSAIHLDAAVGGCHVAPRNSGRIDRIASRTTLVHDQSVGWPHRKNRQNRQ